MRMGHLALGAMGLLCACKDIQGTCDRRAGAGTCEEVRQSTIVSSKEYDCTKSDDSTRRGTWSKDKCDRTGAIGACENSSYREWYYPSGRITKIEHVAQLCSMGTLLGPDGKKLTGVKAEQLGDGPDSDPGLDKMIAGTPNLVQTVDAISKISLPSGAPSGTVKATGGKHISSGIVVNEDDLRAFADRSANPSTTLPSKDANDFHACGIAVKQKVRWKSGDGDMKRVLTWCATQPFLLVIRHANLVRPDIRNGSEFVSGKVTGQVYVYELPSGKALGGFTAKAENSDKSKPSQLDDDLRVNFQHALDVALKKADPGATLSFPIEYSPKGL